MKSLPSHPNAYVRRLTGSKLAKQTAVLYSDADLSTGNQIDTH